VVIEKYESREEFVDAVAERLAQDWPADLRLAAADAIAAGADAEEHDGGQTALELRLGRWFLRDDDLPFFQVVGVIGPLVATLIATGGLAAPAVVGGAVSLMGSAWQVWRKGGRLTSDQVAALTVLKARGPLTEQELAGALAADGVDADAGALLAQLKDVELADGSGAALVRLMPEGRWRTVNV
jgi:hypothetical protein